YTGEVKALVGGRGEKKGSLTLNRATQSLRQPGSSIKPIGVYAPAVENNIITPNSVYVDKPLKYGSWTPKNSSGGYAGPMTIRTAIAKSVNTVAVQVCDKLGVGKAFAFLEKLGISSLTPADKSLALSLGGVDKGISPLEMGAAYATFPNEGVYNKPHTYSKVVNPNGDVILENKDVGVSVMKVSTAQTMISLLRGPVTSGTATAANFSSSYDICGKTGTTNSNKDRWFVGFTPYYTAAIWFGYDQPKSMAIGGSNPCVVIFSKIMSKVHSKLKLKAKHFVLPAGLNGPVEELSPSPSATTTPSASPAATEQPAPPPTNEPTATP
ncbi:transglycosylase domain-containing protein, partial [Treponema sp. R6D11]